MRSDAMRAQRDIVCSPRFLAVYDGRSAPPLGDQNVPIESEQFVVTGALRVTRLGERPPLLREPPPIDGVLVVLDSRASVSDHELTGLSAVVEASKQSTIVLDYDYWYANVPNAICLLIHDADPSAIPIGAKVTFVKRQPASPNHRWSGRD
jgi:hypothetical protein